MKRMSVEDVSRSQEQLGVPDRQQDSTSHMGRVPCSSSKSPYWANGIKLAESVPLVHWCEDARGGGDSEGGSKGAGLSSFSSVGHAVIQKGFRESNGGQGQVGKEAKCQRVHEEAGLPPPRKGSARFQRTTERNQRPRQCHENGRHLEAFPTRVLNDP